MIKGRTLRWLKASGWIIILFFLFPGCTHKDANRAQGFIEGEFVYVASPFAGELKELQAQKGRQVKAGDPLFTLESTPEKAARDEALAALNLSEKELERQKKLFNTPGAAAEQDFDRARSKRDQDRERLTQVEWNYTQKRQTAPKAGLVFDTLYREGEWVPAGRPVIALLPPQNIKVRAFVPEPRIGALHIRDKVKVHVDGLRKPLDATVSFISPKAEFTPPVIYSKESRSKLVFMVEAVFEPVTAADLHPGQPVDVEFGIESK